MTQWFSELAVIAMLSTRYWVQIPPMSNGVSNPNADTCVVGLKKSSLKVIKDMSVEIGLSVGHKLLASRLVNHKRKIHHCPRDYLIPSDVVVNKKEPRLFFT